MRFFHSKSLENVIKYVEINKIEQLKRDRFLRIIALIKRAEEKEEKENNEIKKNIFFFI